MNDLWKRFIFSGYPFASEISCSGNLILKLGSYSWELLAVTEKDLLEAYIELYARNLADKLIKEK